MKNTIWSNKNTKLTTNKQIKYRNNNNKMQLNEKKKKKKKG